MTEVADILDLLVGEALMYTEGGKCLALATAPTPRDAARRIRAQREEQPARGRLAVVAS